MNKTKVFIDWSYQLNPSPNHVWVNSDIENCDIIISINHIKKLNKNAYKILWLLEPEEIKPELYNKAKKEQLNYNLIATHCENFTSKIQHIKIDPCVPSWIENESQQIYNKEKNISMIASTKILCKGHEYRQEIANNFKDKLDLFGHGREIYLKNKIDGLKDYRFSIAMENSCADTYFTEKLLDCFLTGCVPIYWGTKKVSNIFNADGIIFLEDFINKVDSFDFQKEYDKRIIAVKENFEKAKQYNFRSEDGVNKILKKIKG